MKAYRQILAACAVIAACGTAWGIDVTRPGDPVIASSGNHPAGEPPEGAIDNSAGSKYLNFDELNTGFTVFPSGTGTVRYLTIITANDAPERDPTTYILEGSNDGVNFDIISTGALAPSTDRFHISSVEMVNTTVYTAYRVTFPTVRNPGSANSMQIGEVQLATAVDITGPDDTVVITFPPGGFTAPNEGVDKLFDNRVGTKLDVQLASGPTTVDITPLAGATVVNGFSIFGANDDTAFPGRTPQSVTIFGTNDGVNFTQLFDTPVTQTVINLFDQEFEFANSTPYTSYRIVFGLPAFDTDLQIGEFQLFGFAPNQAPPSNDECSNPRELAPGTVSGTTILASGSDITACGSGDVNDVWYSYTASASGRVEVNTCESNLDTTLAVYSTCGGAAIACDDNACFLQSVVRFDVVANQTYLIRVAAVGGTGTFRLTLVENVIEHTDQFLTLNYNFNGMTHAGENGVPDEPNGYRAISDRGLDVNPASSGSLATGGIIAPSGLTYDIVRTAGTLDIVHLGDRNTVDNLNHAFDLKPNGDEIGIQPTWLPNSDQTGPQVSDVSSANIVFGPDTKLGLLYQISNGGGSFECILTFSDSSTVPLFLNGPDWFFDNVPEAPSNGTESQLQLGVFAGTENIDFGDSGAFLNVVEAVVSTNSILKGGLGDVTGRTLSSITFQNRTNLVAGYAIISATARDSVGEPSCRADFNNDGFANSQDFFDFLVAFFALAPNADFNDDGFVNSQDFFDFLIAFFAGC